MIYRGVFIKYTIKARGRGWVPREGFNYRRGEVGPWRQISVIRRSTLDSVPMKEYRGPGLWPIIVAQNVSKCILQETDTMDALGGRMWRAEIVIGSTGIGKSVRVCTYY